MPKLTFIPALLPISNKLHNVLNKQYEEQLKTNTSLSTSQYVVFNFRDKNYSSEEGGYHPVEIAICKSSAQQWTIEYITDFAYMGSYYPELERSIDFDFRARQFVIANKGWLPMNEQYAAVKLYQMWEKNFLTYVDMEVFDEIEVTPQ